MIASSSVIFGLIGYFVKISKEGKRRDRVTDKYEEECPLTAEESNLLSSANNIK